MLYINIKAISDSESVTTKKSILIVEDQSLIALSTQQTLERFGYTTTIADTGEKAITDALGNKNIQLVLMDIVLGSGIDGIETAKKILEKRDMPIVFFTNYLEEEYINKVKHITRYGYIPKISSPTFLKSYIEMTFQLFEANQEILRGREALIKKERLSAVGELASGVAHNFNNMLAVIMGNIEIALLEASLPDKVVKRLSIAKSAVKNATASVQKLQRFAGNLGVQSTYTAVNLNTVLDETIEQTQPLWKTHVEEKGLQITIIKNYTPIKEVDGNREELRDVFFNLIKNAVEAMPQGGTLTFETASTALGSAVRITDTGTGMSEETQKKIFDPFYTTKEFNHGRGLGMNTVYSTIRDHQGEVFVKESVLGKGTTMEVVLPHSLKPTEISTNTITAKKTVIANVLLVDDDDMLREMGFTQLKMMGHKAEVAASGIEALKMLETNPTHYDLVITDIGMPEMNGWQLAEYIKNTYPGLKVVVLSGHDNESLAPEEKEKRGVVEVQEKPITYKALERLIEKLVPLNPDKSTK